MNKFPTLLALTASLACSAADRIYVSSFLDGTVIRVEADGTRTTVASALGNPHGIALTSDGTLYVGSGSSNRILRKPEGGAVQIFASGTTRNGFTALAFDRNGSLFVANQTAGSITLYETTGQGRQIVRPVTLPFGLVFDARGALYVSHAASTRTGGFVSNVAPDGTLTTLVSDLKFPRGLAFDAAGNLWIADYGNGRIVRRAPDGTVTPVVTGLSGPSGIAFNSEGELLVVEETAGVVTRIGADNKPVQIITGLHQPLYIAVQGDSTLPSVALAAAAPSEGPTVVTVRGPLLGYQEVQRSLDLVHWQPIGMVQVVGGDTITVTDPTAVPQGTRFYRTRVMW